jgi:hypothetical protein
LDRGQQRRAAFAGGPSLGRKCPWRAAAASELPLMLFCKSKSPAH